MPSNRDLSPDRQQFVDSARKLYDERLKKQLEAEHFGKGIGLEPETCQYQRQDILR